jgi:hypothetical protein
MIIETRQMRRARERAEAKAEAHKNKKKQAGGVECQLLIVKHSQSTPKLEFQCATITIPKKPSMSRSSAINALHNDWAHDGYYSAVAAEYLAHSPSLTMAQAGIVAKNIWDINHMKMVDAPNLSDLGCVIEFRLSGPEIYTDGPMWMSKAEVLQKASQLKQKNQHTHSILENRESFSA